MLVCIIIRSLKYFSHPICIMWYLVIVLAIVAKGTDAQTPDHTLDWWETALIYYIYPRSFMDSNGDGVGDINGKNVTCLKKYGMANF